ncbi:hypothetical protein [Piscirickettsia salmonis]|uniref:hypothetical protein n=1 Tax=Piscirickettsia salmonis TaxID=1238 RepID=UPI00143D6743|nr:hypothetical protein [Piscirickettsia salmonis]QIX57602.1 hypothetical protein GW536_19840 [Piscirickettsia salmonis]
MHKHIDASPPTVCSIAAKQQNQGQTNKAALTWGVENYQSLEQCTQINHLRGFII